MSQCSWGSSLNNGREYSNMNFKIMNNANDYYYNGMMKIINKDKISVKLDLILPNRLSVTSEKEINVNNAKTLEAWFVLKNTLTNIIKYVLSLPIEKRDIVFKNNKIFNNLFELGTDTDLQNDIFKNIYNDILFKGVGDLFQEINAVCLNGGYTGKPVIEKGSSENTIYEYSNNIANRFFAANDRPSGTRFIFMLINGDPDEINKKAFGGYFSRNYKLLVSHPDNKFVCEFKNK
jgi:hypothetical protein